MLDLFAHRNLSKVLVSACASEKQIGERSESHTHICQVVTLHTIYMIWPESNLHFHAT